MKWTAPAVHFLCRQDTGGPPDYRCSRGTAGAARPLQITFWGWQAIPGVEHEGNASSFLMHVTQPSVHSWQDLLDWP
jgi:hypothetical protein